MNRRPNSIDEGRASPLERLIAQARAALLWEAVWPRLALAGAIFLGFVALSWLGLWSGLAPAWRMAGVALTVLALLFALVPLARLHAPGRARALARIDAASGLAHRPATALADRLSTGQDDALTRAFWALHRREAEASAQRLNVGLPRPGLAARDPRAFRFAVVLAALIGFFIAGDERLSRLGEAFDWSNPAAQAAPPRLDAWVTPPPYTRRAPIFLTGAQTGAEREDVAGNPDDVLRVPVGSTVIARTSGGAMDLAVQGELQPGKEPAADAPAEAVREWTFEIRGDGSLAVAPQGGGGRTWRFAAIPDHAPDIRFTGPPKAGPRGQTVLGYRMSDDYGIASAEARITPRDASVASPLVDAPKVPLVLPQRRGQGGEAVTSQDLLAHPWAGASVTITLEARDQAGNIGRSEPVETVLPERSFRDPVARALVEQRRRLALDLGKRPSVERALDALGLYPDRFTPKASTYLTLRSAYWRLKGAEGTEDLKGLIDYLWQIALHLEDGEMTDIERDLKAAQEALREALERGAPEEEVKRLTQNLREALERFLAEMARRAQTAEQVPPGAVPPNAQMVRPDDLRKMLDRLEQFAEQGSREAAQNLLSELNQILDGLNPNATAQADPMSEEMAQMLGELDRMIREQNELRDRTYQEGQGQRRPGQPGQQGQQGDGQQGQGREPGQAGMGGLAQDQNALRQRLQELMKRMQEQGLNGDPALGEAGEEMGTAGGQLGEGNASGAVGAQGRALEALRKGAQGMAQQMFGEGDQPGQDGPGQGRRMGQRGYDQEVDPLGRPTRTRRYDPGTSVRVPGEIDAQRARRVLEELRRRLSDPARPEGELDYLERLIEP